MSLNQWIFALAGILGPAFVLTVMHRRGLSRQFPLFSKYLILYMAISSLGFATYLYSSAAYSLAYWILAFAMMAMELAVIYEVLATTLKSYSALVDLAKVLFRWAAVFLFMMALLTAFAANGPQVNKITTAMNVVDHSIRLLQCGLLLFLLVFENRLGVSWRNHGMAIAMGLGVCAAVDLTISYFRMLSLHCQPSFEIAGGTVYMAVVGFWGCVLAMREPSPKSILDSDSRLIFQRWNEALMATPLMARNNQVTLPVESFLPGVERAVERVMARRISN